jgi:chromosome segregation protein
LYLKRLELYGFKTFAERTSLEFGPGVIGIVGPNGSGKSNLADAILWSLGEQSMKSLRSNRAGDVIFAGSEDRKRLGVAEVSLTLDNSDGYLPLDFSEITITRRVFRSGEGEYLINRVPCRLRDIHELFLDTGIGKNAYSMIGQQEIDRILSVRSEDRREIFEQAAGIQRYRQRKNEAGRKLDRVCANLTRVNDIIHELESQLEPLAAQSETAREYRQVSKELFDLKLSLMVHQRAAMMTNLGNARQRRAELERETEQAQTRSHQLAAEEVQLRARLQELEGRLDETRTLVGRLGSEVERADGRRNLAQQRVDDTRGQHARATEELAAFDEQGTSARAELATGERERPALEARAEELRAEIAARQERLKAASGDVRQTGESVEEQRAEHLETLREQADVRNRLGQCDSLLEAARARISRLREEHDAAAADRARLSAEANEARRTVEQARSRRDEQGGAVAAMRLEQETAEAMVGELLDRQSELREQLSAARSRHAALTEMEKARDGLRAGARAVLAAAEQGKLSGEYRAVADLVAVPRGLEAAIEAALGPAAGDLVVPSPAEAAEAIAFLKQTRGGQATFLPRSSMRVGVRPAGVAELTGRDGCRGAAADVVECRAGAEEIVEHFLGRVLVVDTLDTAFEVSRESAGWRAIVTLEGDVLHLWGAITGGSPGTGSGPIGRAREIADLQAEADRLAQELAKITADLARTRDTASRAREQADQRLEEAEQLGREVTAAERRLEVIAEKARLTDERKESLLAECRALEEEASQIEQDRSSALAALAEIDKQRGAAEQAMAQTESALATGRDEREELSSSTGELRVALTSVEGDARALDARIDKIRQSLRMLEAAMEDRRSLVDRLVTAEQEGQEACEERARELERLKEARLKAEEELARWEEERTNILDQLAANREAAAGLRAEIEAMQNRAHRLELRLTQIEGEISFCERTLAEEYRISLEEAERRTQPIDSRTAAQQRVKELQGKLEGLGDVNVGAIEEYDRVKERLEFLGGQRQDLEAAREDLHQAIVEIDGEARTRFLAAFQEIQREFQEFFTRLFGGGRAELSLSDPDDVLECGVDVTVTVPGKKTRDLLQLSGGERALTAAAILFALLKVKPSPFVILDEVDAPLDDSNIGRYSALLREFARESQFIVITHNKGTMEATDVLYGVTVEEAGMSKLIGMRLRDPEEAAARAVVPISERREERPVGGAPAQEKAAEEEAA